MPRPPLPASNARARVVVDYGPDPARRHVLGLFRDVVARVSGALVAPYAGDDFNPSTTYHGQENLTVQSFAGAGLGGASPTRDGGHATISSGVVEGPHGDPARRIFADRLRRRTTL